MRETLTDADRSWVLLTVGAALTFSALGYITLEATGVLLTGVAFILFSFLALWD